MKKSEITLVRDVGAKIPTELSANCLMIQNLRQEIVTGKGIRHFFAYERARLFTHEIDLLPKPFNTAVLLRLLSRGQCTIHDERGRSQTVGVKILAKLFAQLVRDGLRKAQLIKEVEAEVESFFQLDSSSAVVKSFLPTESPIYLRTDLAYGLRSGGSVGHIAGSLTIWAGSGPACLCHYGSHSHRR